MTGTLATVAGLFAMSGTAAGNAARAQARDSAYESKMHAPGVRMIPVDGGK
ncbi:MAG TPA: hypothetical protein VFW04_11645 [Gemmatimonadaceae bacterium]|nr:hypothetical protein [Gemmatimonadaceae bacterium]